MSPPASAPASGRSRAQRRNVLISGAGPAGLTLAYWLSRHGFCPTVVERAPAPRDGGQAVDIRGAAIDVARRAGILGALRQARTRTRGMTYVGATGKHLASMNAAFGVVDAADVEIVRGDLVGILHEAARSGAEYIFGDSVTGMAEVPGAVEVTFERAEPRTFDLVIGADGLHSTLRALAFGPEPSFVRHLGMYLSVFTVPNDMGLDHWQLIHVAPGKSVTVTSARDNTEAQGHLLLRLPAPRLRPPRHRPAAGAARSRVRRAGLGDPAAARGHARRPRLLLRFRQPDPHGQLVG